MLERTHLQNIIFFKDEPLMAFQFINKNENNVRLPFDRRHNMNNNGIPFKSANGVHLNYASEQGRIIYILE